MIIDVHRHMVVNGTVQGDYIRGAQKSFSMMYRKVHNVEISDRDFTEKIVRPLIDPNADNIIAEMDQAGVDKTVTFGVDYGLLFGEAPIHDNVGAEKILFATDAPYPNLMCPLKEWVKVFSEPDTKIPFTQEEKEMILGKAACKVLGL